MVDNYVNWGIYKDKIFILFLMIKDVERNNIYFKCINCNLVYCGKLFVGYYVVEIIKVFKYKLVYCRNYNLYLIVVKIMIND